MHGGAGCNFIVHAWRCGVQFYRTCIMEVRSANVSNAHSMNTIYGLLIKIATLRFASLHINHQVIRIALSPNHLNFAHDQPQTLYQQQ